LSLFITKQFSTKKNPNISKTEEHSRREYQKIFVGFRRVAAIYEEPRAKLRSNCSAGWVVRGNRGEVSVYNEIPFFPAAKGIVPPTTPHSATLHAGLFKVTPLRGEKQKKSQHFQNGSVGMVFFMIQKRRLR